MGVGLDIGCKKRRGGLALFFNYIKPEYSQNRVAAGIYLGTELGTACVLP